MNQNHYLKELIKSFEEEVSTYSEETNALSYTFLPSYKGNEDIDHIFDYKAFVEYEGYTLIYRFTVHSFLSQVNHILDCYICFEDSLPYPIHHLLGYYDIRSTKAYIIPCISNVLTLKESFRLLAHNIESVKDALLSYDHHDFISEYHNLVVKYSHIDDSDFEEDYHYAFIEDIQIFETDICYINYLLGKNDEALKKYHKKNNVTVYEEMIMSMLEEGCSFDDQLPYSVIYNLKSYDKNGMMKTDIKEIMVMIIAIICLTLGWGAFYYVLHFIFSKLLLRNAMFYIGEDPFFIFLPAFISSIATSYFARFRFYKILFKKDYHNYIEKEYVTNTPKTNLFMFRFTKLVLILSMVFVMLMTNCTIQFNSDGVVDNSSFFKLKGTYYAYEDIELYYYDDQKNAFDDLIGEPTYVIHTENEDIDLYYYCDVNDLEKNIIPYLKDKGVNITYKEILEWS